MLTIKYALGAGFIYGMLTYLSFLIHPFRVGGPVGAGMALIVMYLVIINAVIGVMTGGVVSFIFRKSENAWNKIVFALILIYIPIGYLISSIR